MRRKVSSHPVSPIASEAARKLRIQPGQKLLVIGGDFVESALWLARQYQIQVTGISPLGEQVQRAVRRLHQSGRDVYLSFEHQQPLNTTFPDAHFDHIWAMEPRLPVSDQQLFLAEAHRLLKPGGGLVLVEAMRPCRPYSKADEAILHRWLALWGPTDLSVGHEVVTWARDLGFEAVQLVDVSARISPTLARQAWLTAPLWPLAPVLRKLPPVSGQLLADFVGAADRYRALDQRLWFEGMLSASKGVIG